MGMLGEGHPIRPMTLKRKIAVLKLRVAAWSHVSKAEFVCCTQSNATKVETTGSSAKPVSTREFKRLIFGNPCHTNNPILPCPRAPLFYFTAARLWQVTKPWNHFSSKRNEKESDPNLIHKEGAALQIACKHRKAETIQWLIRHA